MLVATEGTKSVDLGRGRLWIIVGFSLAALAAILFAVIVTAQPRGQSGSASTQSSTHMPNVGDDSETAPTYQKPGPEAPAQSFAPPDAPIMGGCPALQGPVTATAEAPPAIVTVTVKAPPVAAAPQPAPSPAASSGGGFLNSTAATIGAATTLVIAVSGLITAATGLVKVLRPRASTAGAPKK